MGIHGLMKLLSEECPQAIKQHDGFAPLTGRKIAIDASMAMYQFLVAVRTAGNASNGAAGQLTNEAGEVTSHIQGMFNRTIKMMEAGIKPCYVFDGKPPNLKSGELAKRIARRAKAEQELADAKASGTEEDIDRFQRRLVKVTRQHNEECKELLRLMGVPVVEAPCEAEAQCAELARSGKVYATATEDMDALTFRTPILIRRLTFSQSSKDKTQPIMEIDMNKVLEGLKMTYEQFVDLCILCGCDYSDTIKGVGPKGALKLIREQINIENVLNHITRVDKKKEIPLDWKEQRILKSDMEIEESLKEKTDNNNGEDDSGNGNKSIGTSKDLIGNENGPDTSNDTIVTMPRCESTNHDGDISTMGNRELDENSPLKVNNQQQGDSSVETKSSEAKGDGILPVSLILNGNDKQIQDTGKTVEMNMEGDDDEMVIIPPLFVQARNLFVKADVKPADEVEVKWTSPDVEGLKSFLVEKMGFNPDRVNNNISRLNKAQQTKSQQRVDSFFTVVSTSSSSQVKKGIKRGTESTQNKKKASKPRKK
jgi:flap endonuclease-1